jgi:hypothetical protein
MQLIAARYCCGLLLGFGIQRQDSNTGVASNQAALTAPQHQQWSGAKQAGKEREWSRESGFWGGFWLEDSEQLASRFRLVRRRLPGSAQGILQTRGALIGMLESMACAPGLEINNLAHGELLRGCCGQ